MKYILRHHYNQFLNTRQTGPYEITTDSRLVCKNILFHHLEDVDNYIRNHVTAQNLVKLLLEHVTIE